MKATAKTIKALEKYGFDHEDIEWFALLKENIAEYKEHDLKSKKFGLPIPERNIELTSARSYLNGIISICTRDL